MAERVTFERFEYPGLQPCPDWWRVRVDEIDAAAMAVEAGEVARVAVTPNGHSVWAVSYGPPQAQPGTGTWAIASNSGTVGAYKTDPDGPQVVVLVCCVHGAEPESTAGAMNLISLMETGQDLRGTERPELVELAANYRLVILPCVNMDGRDVSPDTLRGASQEDFVRASQGMWADGTSVGYPTCKKYSPLPLEQLQHPGGYPNGDGYNIMHDACPGDLRTAEATGLLKLIADEQADLIVHLHSHSIGGRVLHPSMLGYPLHAGRIHAYQQRVHDALDGAGLRPADVLGPGGLSGINLVTASSMASGGLALTHEQSATDGWTFDEAVEEFYVVLETFLRHGLDEPFSPREAVARGRTE